MILNKIELKLNQGSSFSQRINRFMNSSRKALTLIFLISFININAQDSWSSFGSKEIGFKIQFPKTPKEDSQMVDTDIGKIKMNLFTYDASQNKLDDNLIYGINFSKYPEELISSDMTELLEEFYRNSIDGAVENVNGKILSEKDIFYKDYTGKE